MTLIAHQKTPTVPDWTQAQLNTIISGGAAPLPPSGTLLSGVVLPSDWIADHDVSGFLANPNTWTGIQTIANVLPVSQSGTNATIIGKVTGNARGTNAFDVQSQRTTNTQVASGTGAIAVGSYNTSSSSYSVAFGVSNLSSGPGASCFGNQCSAIGLRSTSIGLQVTTSGDYSIGIGTAISVSGYYAIMIGSASSNDFDYSVAIGAGSNIGGSNSVGIGFGCNAGNTSTVSIGQLSTASGLYSTAIGNSSTASGPYNLAVGSGCQASESSSGSCVAIGVNVTNSTKESVQIGYSNTGKFLYSSNGLQILNGTYIAVDGSQGITATITTTKLTPVTGANGSMTFKNGILTAQTQAT